MSDKNLIRQLQCKLEKVQADCVKLFERVEELQDENDLLKKMVDKGNNFSITDLDGRKCGSYMITRTEGGEDKTTEMY